MDLALVALKRSVSEAERLNGLASMVIVWPSLRAAGRDAAHHLRGTAYAVWVGVDAAGCALAGACFSANCGVPHGWLRWRSSSPASSG